MSQFRPLAVLGAGILLVFLTAGVKTAQQAISLEFKPNAKIKASPASVPSLKIFFGEFRDERADPRQIGENLEDKAKRVIITTDDPRASGQFIGAALAGEFRKKGFRLVDQPAQADKIIAGTVLKFWTVETSRYNTETQVKVEVRDPSGGVTFSRLLTGTGKNFGRSLSETNYNESFSDSLVPIVEALYQDQDFIKALGEKPAPARTAAPTPPLVKEPSAAEMKAPIRTPDPQPAERPLPSKKADRLPVTAKASEPERQQAPEPARAPKPPAAIPEKALPKTPPVQAATEPEKPRPEFIEHRVIPGETLATIAKWYAGDTTLWPAIAQHNLGLNPFKLKGGEVVKVPLALATEHTEQPEHSTAAGPSSRPLKKGSKTPPPPPTTGSPPPPASPVFGPK